MDALQQFVDEHRGKVSDSEIRAALKKAGWDKADIKKAMAHPPPEPVQHTKAAQIVKSAISFFALFALLGIAYTYFFIINPSFIEKPFVQRPFGQADQALAVPLENFEFLLNEIGAYKLRRPPFSEDNPRIEMIVTDSGQTVSATVIENKIQVKQGGTNPDIRIRTDRTLILRLSQSDNVLKEVGDAFADGKFSLEFVAPADKLILKGYKSIYDIQSRGGSLTGNVVRNVRTETGSSIVLLLSMFLLFLLITPSLKA